MGETIRLGTTRAQSIGACLPLRAPAIFHFGEHDRSIPPEAIARPLGDAR